MATRRPVQVKVSGNGFELEEEFPSKADAFEWKRMIEETLRHPDLMGFDLPTYAAGLAAQVRRCGGPYVRQAWLSGCSTPEQWAKGDPVSGYERKLRDGDGESTDR